MMSSGKIIKKLKFQKGNTLLIVLVLGITLAGAYFLITRSQKDAGGNDKSIVRSDIPEGLGAVDEISEEETGISRYIEYTLEDYEIHKGEKRVLFFYANWCPTCQPVDAELKNNDEKIPEDITVIRVNYNDSDTDGDEKKLANKYAITYQHTFVILDEEENAVQTWNGGSLDEILEKLN